ncbi:MAG: hypothetical protein LBG86_01385, partial [Puniceicoccales bacterium]|nr:hypothetical protein [Puniceicoccales bacterium]
MAIVPTNGNGSDRCDVLWGDRNVAKKIYGTDDETSAKKYPFRESSQKNENLSPEGVEIATRHIPHKKVKKKFISDHEIARSELLQETEHAWRGTTSAPIPTDCHWNLEETPSPLQMKLQRIIIPKICLQNVPLREGIDAIGELSEKLDNVASDEEKGINIIVLDEPEDGGKIHLTLRNISLEKTIQRIAQSVGYEYDLEDDAVILTSAEKNGKRLLTHFFPISRGTVVHLTNLRSRVTDAGNREQIQREEDLLRLFFQNAGVDFSSVPGARLAFDGQQLIVTQTPRNLKHVRQILSRYEQIKQVEIETKFIEIQEGTLDELQFRWSATNDHGTLQTGTTSSDSLRTLSQAFGNASNSHGDGKITMGGEYFVKPETIAIPNNAPSSPTLSNISQPIVPLVDVISIISGTQMGTMMRAIEQHSGSDLMSAPKVTVLSGKTAEIVVAQEMRYPEEYDEIQSSVGSGSNLTTSTAAGVTITAGTPRNFKTRNIGVEMVVTPFVEADNKITLQLEPTVTEFEGYVEYGGVSVAVAGGTTVTVPSGFFQPIFTTRKIRTEVTIENGATVVMGGLTREEIKEIHDKIPILGD